MDAEVEDVMARPGTGKLGRAVKITCNHFSFQLKLEAIYQYCVEFNVQRSLILRH